MLLIIVQNGTAKQAIHHLVPQISSRIAGPESVYTLEIKRSEYNEGSGKCARGIRETLSEMNFDQSFKNTRTYSVEIIKRFDC